jgi:hypothetical protein
MISVTNGDEVVRDCSMGTASEGTVEKIRCEFTGAEIFAPVIRTEALTLESVREMLTDFP